MRRRRSRRGWGLVQYWLVGLVTAVIAQGGVNGINLVVDALVCGISVVALANIHWHVFPKMRRWPYIATVPIVAAIYVFVVVAAIAFTIVIVALAATGSIAKAESSLRDFFLTDWQNLRYPIEIALVISIVSELARRIGPSRIWDLARGRYRNPREETRVFLLIDLRGSTPLAESLGAVKFSVLLREIFDDLTEPVLDTDGDVVGYVGDEAIISWPFKRGLANGNALRCFQLFKERIASRSAEYERQFGIVPRFRAAIHAGPIVATEVGQIRTDVALHGDALNTAARVLAECNALEAELLMTGSVASQLTAEAESLGEFQLRGRDEPVELYAVRGNR